MYVSKVKIKGVRGFDGPRAVDLDLPQRADGSYAGWTVLAGRNGSGKSTFLQAIILALAGPRNAGALAMPNDWLVDGRPRQSWIELNLVRAANVDPLLEDWRGSVSINWDAMLFSEAGGDEGGIFWGYGGRPFQQMLDRGPWSVLPNGWLYLGYGPFRRHSRPVVGVSELDSSREAGFRTLFDEDATLVEGVSWLIGQHLLRLEGKSGAGEVLDAVLRLLGDGLLPDGFQVCKVDSEGLWVKRADGKEFPLRRMSDGYRTVGALVVDIVRRMHLTYGRLEVEERDGVPTLPYPGVVLIDEVDAHLHVSWQKKIGNWLKAHFPEIQFIVTTHSPYICQSADPGGLIRLPGPDEQEPPRVVDDDLYRRIVYGSGDDAVLSELFGLETPYSEEAERLRERLGDLEGKVLDGEASEDELAEYERLSKKLQSSLSARVREVSSRLEDEA
ncbi:AAA family ATPase [Actinomadura keratinilytica]|uniref:AAA family ATPase n=1 Tax=Actinomadura keratinilytica TaxID=547461 RepID=A0ABP7Z8L4_9ACTN